MKRPIRLDPDSALQSGGSEPGTEAEKLIRATMAAAKPEGGESPGPKPKQLPEEGKDDENVSLDIEGVSHTLSKADLVKAVLKARKADSTLAVADDRLQEVAAVKQLVALVERLDPDQTAGFQRALANPELLAQLVRGEIPPDDDDDDDLAILTGGTPKKTAKENAGLRSELNQLTDAVRILLQREQANQAEKDTKSRKVNLEKVLKSVDLFRDNDAARGMALGHVMNEIALNPEADVAQVVRNVAKQIQASITNATEDEPETGRVPYTKLKKPTKAFTGKQMESGSMADNLLDVLGGL